MGLKKSLITLAIIYILVLTVNISANYNLYVKGQYWQFSIAFSLIVATLGWLGYVCLYRLFFVRLLLINKHPNATLIVSTFISGIYGTALMILVMKSLVWFFHRPEHSNFNYTNNCIYAALFAMMLGLVVNGQDFLRQLKQSAEENERMKKEMLQSQYDALKNQVNPHFFFNTLNTLAILIPEQPGIAVQFVQQLSKVFRYSIQEGHKKTVESGTELKIVMAYIFLNEQRFGAKLTSEINVDAGVMCLHIATQALLMLVENIVKHNEISTAYPLHIHVYNESDQYLVVTNTCQPKTQTEPSTGIGLSNVINRYAFLTYKQVVIEKNGMFTVKIPLLPDEHINY